MAIFEQRTYSIAVGMVEDYLRFYHQEGMAIHTKFLGPPHAWFTTDVGALTEIIMMWLAFIPKTRPYIVKMENKILKPAFFSPLQ